jgi:hypothetical protein
VGGGPLGGQIGIPSYFMPEATYSPFWHIGFTNWVKPRNGRIVKSINELKALRASGDIQIREWPAKLFPETDPRWHAADGYDFDSVPPDDLGAIPGFFNIVNCPTPITIDFAIHKANKLVKAAILANE